MTNKTNSTDKIETANTTIEATDSTKKTRRRRTRKADSQPDWTIVTALSHVLSHAHASELKPEFWEVVSSPMAFLCETLSMTKMQILALAMLIDSGRNLSYRNMAAFLKTSRLEMMAFANEIEEMVSRRWFHHANSDNESEAFALAKGVTDALSKNKVFVPERIDNLSEDKFYNYMNRHFQRAIRAYNAIIGDELDLIDAAVDANPQLELSQMVKDLGAESRMLFLLIVDDYVEWNNTSDEGVTEDCINKIFDDDEKYSSPFLMVELQEGSQELIKKGWVEHTCTVEGMAETDRYSLTREVKDRLFKGKTKLLHKHRRRRNQSASLTSHKDIKEKALFYNADEEQQITRLESLLTKEQLPQLQKRLEEMNMRKGFAILFYGAPGCGKTETVLQLARKTGRDIMLVDIASMRDKYVGESEKNIKQVFDQYREVCKERSGNIPILLFNEADALIGKRTNNADSSVDKMNNAMMNILLQELETFEGILIATTNLTANMDSAFERRFLFKTEFHKPDVDVKAKIWTSMIDGLTETDAQALASKYDFSGGEIENIARKQVIEYILSGEKSSFDALDKYCQEEKISSKKKAIPVAGFRV